MANHKADREVLNHLLKDYEHTMLEFEKYRSDILDYQSGVVLSTSQAMNLVNLPKVNPSEVYSDIQAIKTYWNGLVEADEEAKKGFIRANNGVNDLGGMIVTFLESIGENGSNLESIDVNQLQTAIFGDKELLETIEGKMNQGESLGPAERELLYRFIQENILNEDVFDQMDWVSELMRNDNDQLKDYINEEVLATEASLAMEIFLLEMYLFAGNKRPSELRGTSNDRIRLNNYLTMLTNYQLLISEHREKHDWKRKLDEPLYARIEDINFEFMKSPINGYLESYIVFTYDPDQYDHSEISREDFLELENPAFSHHSISEVEYFYGPNVIENFFERDILYEHQEIDTQISNLISAQLFEMALNFVPGGKFVSLPYSNINTRAEYRTMLEDNEQKLTVKRLKQIASEFHLDIQVNTNNVDSSSEDMKITIHPTDKTIDLIERWKIVYQLNPEIPYPEKEIHNMDWEGINNFLYKENNKETMTRNANDELVFDYIFNGTQADHPIIQEAQEIIEGN